MQTRALVAWILFSGLALGGCSQGHADMSTPGGMARIPAGSASGPPARAIVRASALPPDTVSLTPETPSPTPTAEYRTLEAVRDSVFAMVRRVTPRGDSAIHLSAGPARFKYWYLPDSATGYAVRVVVTDSTFCPVEEVAKALTDAGWAYHSGYSADGTDGTVMGFETVRYVCILEGRWDGGDDSDPTYVPAPGCEMTATCIPRRNDDVPPY